MALSLLGTRQHSGFTCFVRSLRTKRPLTSGIAPTHQNRRMLRLSIKNVRKCRMTGVKELWVFCFCLFFKRWFICVPTWRFDSGLATPPVLLFFPLVLFFFCTFCTSRNGTKCYNPDSVPNKGIAMHVGVEVRDRRLVPGLRTLSTRLSRPPRPSRTFAKASILIHLFGCHRLYSHFYFYIGF